ncbi:MAG: hypothetical protein EBX50_19420 [Chitinophagia bacterium]|nr:hypothetical protein [Chitinophagia bacterium]
MGQLTKSNMASQGLTFEKVSIIRRRLLMIYPILYRPNDKKQDGELTAFYRFIDRFKKDHPHLQCIMALDALYCNIPVITKLKFHGLHFIVTAKQEAFAGFVANGNSLTASYKMAFSPPNSSDTTIMNKASELMRRDYVQARVNELVAQNNSVKQQATCK